MLPSPADQGFATAPQGAVDVQLPPQLLGKYLRFTEKQLTLNNLVQQSVVTANANRVAVIISNQSATVVDFITTKFATALGNGLVVNAQSPILNLTVNDFGTLAQVDLFGSASGPSGPITVIELIYTPT